MCTQSLFKSQSPHASVHAVSMLAAATPLTNIDQLDVLLLAEGQSYTEVLDTLQFPPRVLGPSLDGFWDSQPVQ